jgi:N-methylhydantoinase B
VANRCTLREVDGSRRSFGKGTRVLVAKGGAIELTTGGGGGYGPAAERDPDAVMRDIRAGYVTEEQARLQYPHAFS